MSISVNSLSMLTAVVNNRLAPSGLSWATPLGALLTTEKISVTTIDSISVGTENTTVQEFKYKA